MIRIVHLINDLFLGGAEHMLVKLLRGMDRDLFTSRVITMLPGGPLVEAARAAGAEVECLGMRRGVPGPLAFARLRRRLKQLRPAILQTWMYHANLLGLFAGTGMPTVWNLRNSITKGHPIPGGWANRVCARLSRRPRAVVVNCEAGRESHEAIGYRPRHWEVLPNAFDLGRFTAAPGAGARLRAELGLPHDATLLGTFARYHTQKGHRILFEALARIAPAFGGLQAVLAGTGMELSNAEVSAMVKEHGLSDRVHLLGERFDVADLMAGVDVVVSPSFCEGFPNVLGEAMAVGTPCVATEAGGCAEVLGDTGVLVPVGDADALADALSQLLDAGPETWSRMGRAARRRVEDRFELHTVAKRYGDFYQGLLA